MPTAAETKTKMLARIIRDVLKGEPFENLADLTADVKTRCARLRIRATGDELTAAYALIESNTPLVRRSHVD